MAEGLGRQRRWGSRARSSAHAVVMQQRYAGRLSAIMPDIYPHARHIARLAAREFEAGKAVPAEQAVPVYIRDKVALKSSER